MRKTKMREECSPSVTLRKLAACIFSFLEADIITYFKVEKSQRKLTKLKEIKSKSCNRGPRHKMSKLKLKTDSQLRCLRTPTQTKILDKVKCIIHEKGIEGLEEQLENENLCELKRVLLQMSSKRVHSKTMQRDIYHKMRKAIRHLAQMLEQERDPPIVYGENDGSDVTSNQVGKAVQALLQLMKDGGNDNKDKNLFRGEGKDIYLSIRSFKGFKVPPFRGQIRLVLPHSILPESPDVCLFSADLQKGKRIDHEPTLEHVKNILSKNGVTEISEVITLRQLKTEYDQYELKRALCNRFDVFLSEAKVCGHIVHHLGKIFYLRKKIPVPIKLDSKDLKKSVETALHKTTLHLLNQKSPYIVKVANSLMIPEQIQENIIGAVTGLRNKFPGGWDNIFFLAIRGEKTLEVPFYLSIRNRKDVKVKPPKKPKDVKSVSGDLDDFRVTVHPSGKVAVRRKETRKASSRKRRLQLQAILEDSMNEPLGKRRKKFSRSKDLENSGGKNEKDGDTHPENIEGSYGGSNKNYDIEDENNTQSANSGLVAIETAYLQKIEKTKALKETSRKKSNTDR